MSALDARIDDLYQLPPSEFTAARNALAKTLKGDEAARVKRLAKPSLVPWAVNQLYWRERRTYDRLMTAGRALRGAQIAALKGRAADLRAAAAEHRAAVADALATATQLAAQSGAHPAGEPLSRMLEAVSLAQEPPGAPGRFTDIVQPAGFEALAGVTPVARAQPTPHVQEHERPHAVHPPAPSKAAPKKHDARAAKAEAAARKAAEAAVHEAKRQLQRAQAAEARASAHADAIRQQLAQAEATSRDATAAVKDAEREVARAEAALREL